MGPAVAEIRPPMATWGQPPRGSRFPRLVSGRGDPEEAISRLAVAVIGTGSVGRVAAVHLARLRVASLLLVDRGRFKPESLITQPIAPADIGEAKASSTGRLCSTISPQTRVFACDGAVERLDPLALADADLVLLATDNLAAEVEVAQRCLRLGRPLIQASVHGGTLTAQVRTFANRDGSGACPVCGYGESEWLHLHRQTRFSCEGNPGLPASPLATAEPTASFSFLCALAADLAVGQMLRLSLGLGMAVEDTLLEYCAYTHRMVVSPLPRNRNCRLDHATLRRVSLEGSLVDLTFRSLAATTGMEASDPAGLCFELDGLLFVEAAGCSCGQRRPLRRFLPPGSEIPAGEPGAGPCPRCGGALRPLPFYTHQVVPAALLGPLLDRTVREVARPLPRWIIVRGPGAAHLVRGRGAQRAEEERS